MKLRTNTWRVGQRGLGLVLGLGMATSAGAVTLVMSGTDTTANGWRPIMASGGGYMTDSISDGQTGQQVSEIVGTTSSPAAYLGYGTISNVDYIGFRVRLGQLSTNENNLKQATWFGFNFDGDNSVDLWVGMDHVGQQSSNWQVVIANATSQNDNTVNVGPSNAGMIYSTGGQSTLPLYAAAAALNTNYSYATASASNTTIGSSFDLDGGTTGADAILSWVVPFATLTSAVNSSGVMGTGYGFNSNSMFTVTVVTSNTQNTVNQDVLGLSGLTGGFTYSAPISAITPIPEPSTFLALGSMFLPFALRRRRRA